ncbi:MAG: CDP-glucose 4,6-dehydratase [Planctomycetota bacterium]|jgi:CDP-glucose 4,6-dehydratase
MFDQIADFYRDKSVLVTGHTGFKGSWLSLWLQALGARVGGLSLEPPTKPALFEILGLESRMDYHQLGDIRSHPSLEQALAKFCPQVVFHLAAQPLVRESYREPRYTYETNVMGTLNLFEAVRKRKEPLLVVNVTTDKCYENNEQPDSCRETDAMGGYDPYSSSKAMSELLTSAYRSSFFHPDKYGQEHRVMVASARAGNVIGGGDFSDDRLIPDLIQAARKGETLEIRSPNSIRPWQFVLEPLAGYLALPWRMEQDGSAFAQAWNFGPRDQDIITVEEVISRCLEILGEGEYRVCQDNQYHEARVLRLDISKATHYLQWKPRYGVYKALEETMEWYRTYFEGSADMLQFSLGQISRYVENNAE